MRENVLGRSFTDTEKGFLGSYSYNDVVCHTSGSLRADWDNSLFAGHSGQREIG